MLESNEHAPSMTSADLDGLPYHPLVYHLDLSILAYQLYGQSLVWPFDPYYEEQTGESDRRARFMNAVRAWATAQGQKQTGGASDIRGPGVLGGFPDNPSHDPILYRYSQIRLGSRAVTNAADRWTEYFTPTRVTKSIGAAYVVYRAHGSNTDDTRIEQIAEATTGDGPDLLIAFEGGTGDKGEPGQPHSQSLMGFVLARADHDGDYDVHIAFRGSRSGSMERAAYQAWSDHEAAGNPDWITDLGYDRLGPEHAPLVTRVGEVHRGFAKSIEATIPSVMHALREVGSRHANRPPRRIFVTGHSLGGALAQHFASAVLMGHQYGPNGPDLPEQLRGWPWSSLKLITYGAPRAGDAVWAKTLTQTCLQSEFFSNWFESIVPFDGDHLNSDDPSIVSRSIDPSRPAAFRVLISTDPITSERGADGKHVGKTVYLDELRWWKLLPIPDSDAHEPEEIREQLYDSVAASNIPDDAWNYQSMETLHPTRNHAERGTKDETRRLGDAMVAYHQNQSSHFDASAFRRDVATYLQLIDEL